VQRRRQQQRRRRRLEKGAGALISLEITHCIMESHQHACIPTSALSEPQATPCAAHSPRLLSSAALPPSPKPPSTSPSFHCSPLLKTLPKTSPLHGISKRRLQQRCAQPVCPASTSLDGAHGLVLPKRVYQLQDDSFEQFKPTTGSPVALALMQKGMRSPTSSRSSTPLNRSPCLSPVASPVIGSGAALLAAFPSLAPPSCAHDFSMKPD